LEDQLPVDMASVALYDPVAQTCTIAARNPKARAVAAQVGVGEGTILPVKDMLLGDCINNKVVYLHDLAVINQPLAHRLVETGLRSAVGTPLVVEGRVLGVLQTARKVEDGFSSAECEFLQMLSEHVALAAHHARLIASLQSAYDELRQTQRAVMQQERLRALGQMASGIAHDVNNALSPIAGYTDLLLNDEPGLGERARRYVTTIRTAAEDIGHTVARLREFYRQRREQDVLAHVNLPGLIQQVIDLTRPRWRDIPQQHGVMVKLAPEVPRDLPSLLGIESEIREALTNLIINAVDAMPQGGTLGLRARTGRLGKSAGAQPGAAGLKRPTHVIIEVSDTGVGMDEETRRRCLEPFFSTKGERGTGLGLSMVYGVVQRHEGDIEVESAPDKGTLVRLIFPLREGPAMVVPPAPEEALPAVRMRILCIDDEPLLREMMKDLLQRDGHTVEVADGGQSGLDKFRAANREGEPFDVVLTDLGMPYIGGHEVARTVKRESPNTPVIVMTGWGSRFVSETKVIAADYVLSKPPKSQELRRLLAHLGRKTSP
jgi:signal transduction histidine kinase/ActR/RegA family two-component response regulator